MSELLSAGIGITKLGSSNESDLKPNDEINRNLPLDEDRCYCCGRHVNELTPFGKDGPLDGGGRAFEGALLVCISRLSAPPDEEIDRIMEPIFGESSICKTMQERKTAVENLTQKYGEEEADNMMTYYELSFKFYDSWECRDCIVLNGDEFYKKREQAYSKTKEDIDMPASP